MTLIQDILERPIKERIQLILTLRTSEIEKNFDKFGISIRDIFYKKTWSLKFIENVLKPEDVDFWDHVSAWYILNDSFCEKNIEWLNYYELVHSQNLSKDFYEKHSDRVDWISS